MGISYKFMSNFVFRFYVYFYYYIKENNVTKKFSKVYENYLKDNLTEASAEGDITNPGERPKLVRRQSSIVPSDEPFPFSSLKEFLPSSVPDQVRF